MAKTKEYGDCPRCNGLLKLGTPKHPELDYCLDCGRYFDEDGKELERCPNCGGEFTQGNFDYVCLKCRPYWLEKCRICGQARLWCSC